MRFGFVGCTLLLASAAGCGSGEPLSSPPSFGGSSGFTTTGGASSVTTGGFGGGQTYDQPVIVTRPAPPPISGGTLLITAKGHGAAVADPERDLVSFVNLDTLALIGTVNLQKGDQPGRLIEDKAGLVHAILRGSSAVVTLDPAKGTELGRQNICPNPRGIAYDAEADNLHVACAGGDLITLKSSGGTPLRVLHLDRDLRDVVIDGSRLLVSRFRSAELLVVEQDGTVSNRLKPPTMTVQNPGGPPPNSPQGTVFAPAVAWRTVPAPGGGAIMVFQEEQDAPVEPQPGGYGGFCGGIVRTAISLLRADGTGWTVPSSNTVLPVDVAVRANGEEVAVVSAAVTSTPGVLDGNRSVKTLVAPAAGPGGNLPPGSGDCSFPPPGSTGSQQPNVTGQVVAVAYDAQDRVIAQTREPLLVVGDRAVLLPGNVIRDTGHEIFHMATSGGIACASCHPEGREDGHLWKFDTIGDRRTQSLGGGTLGTGPYHWSGDMTDFSMLAHEVFNSRMSGPQLLDAHVGALSDWIAQIPAWKAEIPADSGAVERGRALFNDTTVGCTGCHAGPAMTTHALIDVGTGGRFKIPSLLGVSFRTPLMHNGCAAQVADRFSACGGGSHGTVANLSDAQKADLVSYMNTL